MGVTDAMQSAVLWPVHTVGCLLEFAVGIVVSIVWYCTKGFPKMNNYQDIYAFCESMPILGKETFSYIYGIVAPYSASVSAVIQSHSPEKTVMTIKERPWLRNPFASVHACALANVAEGCTGIAAVGSMERAGRNVRGIPIRMSLDYLVKARGKLTATAYAFDVPKEVGRYQLVSHVDITNEEGVTVTTCDVTWTVNVMEPKPKKKKN